MKTLRLTNYQRDELYPKKIEKPDFGILNKDI